MNSDIKNNWMGARMVAAGLITEEQRAILEAKQKELQKTGEHIRFGNLAVSLGFCTAKEIESLPGYIGERLRKAGLISEEQCKALLEWQKKLQEVGIYIRFGDLIISEGICTADDIEIIINKAR